MLTGKKSKKLLQLIILLVCLNQLLINFANFSYAENIIVDVPEKPVVFSWEETESSVISNIFISDNETYTFDSIDVKFTTLPNENLKLSITKIDKQSLPEQTNANSDAYDIKLINENNEEITEGFNISVTFHEIEEIENVSVISFDDIKNLDEAKTENFSIDDGNIVVEVNHLTIFLVTKIIDHTSGTPPTDYIYSNIPTDSPSTALSATINTKENNLSNPATYIQSRGFWPLVSTQVGSDYIDFFFGNISSISSVNNISFITNFRVQPNSGSSGISGNVNVNSYDAKLYAKNISGTYLDLNINKQDLVPNLSTGQSQLSSNYEEITIPISSSLISQLDLSNFVIRYALAGEHTGNHSGVTGLASYIDSVGLDVAYVPDSTPPAVPTLLSPLNNSFTKPVNVILDWSDVTDISSPVTYKYKSSWLGGNYGPVSTGTNSFIDASASADNTYNWQVQACDSLNNCSNFTDPWTITIDGTAPNSNPTGFSSSPVISTLSNDNTVNVLWTTAGTDVLSGVDGYSYSFTNTSTDNPDNIKDIEETATNITSTSLQDGTWYFHIKTVDNAGNWSNTTTNYGPFVIETVAPTLIAVSITSDNLNTTTATTADTITITFTSNETINTPAVTILGQTATVTNIATNTWKATYKITGTETEGVITFAINFTDIATNNGLQVTTTSDSSLVTLDTTIPTISDIVLTNTTTSNNNFVKNGDQVTLTAKITDTNQNNITKSMISANLSDFGGGISVNPISYNIITGLATWANITTANTTNSLVKVTLNANDLAGNLAITGNITIQSDNTNPIITITNPINPGDFKTIYTNLWDGLITGTSDDTISVVENVLLSVYRNSDLKYFDGFNWVTSANEILINTTSSDLFKTWSYNINPDPAGNDTYYITTHVQDFAKNLTENTNQLIIIFDTQIPETALSISPTNPDGDNDWYISNPTISLSATDNFKTNQIYYQINSTNGAWQTYTNPIKINIDGDYKFYYKSIDQALNYSNINLKNFKLDKTPPDGVTDVSAKYENNEVKISWNVEDLNIYQVLIYRGYSKYVQEDIAHLIASNSQTEEDITDSDIELDNTYYYKLVTIDEAGNVGDTNLVKIVIPATIKEQAEITIQTVPTTVDFDTVEEISNKPTNNKDTPNLNNTDKQVLGIEDIKKPSSNFNFWWLFLILFPVGLTWWLIKKRQE